MSADIWPCQSEFAILYCEIAMIQETVFLCLFGVGWACVGFASLLACARLMCVVVTC